ncbi:MAG TPA: NINE protein [Chroococcidiopsis sp.]
MQPNRFPPSMNQIGTSYVLWMLWIFGIGGIHRIYNKRYLSGIVWLLTFGLFGIGQVIDILLIPEMVNDHNNRVRMQFGMLPNGMMLTTANPEMVVSTPPVNPQTAPAKPTEDELMLQLLRAAQARGGKISVTQGVLDTSSGFEEVEATLKAMVKTGYVAVSNDPNTGVVVYDFVEL